MKKLIHLIAAARPNFMKVAPLYHALTKESLADPKIVHTGQHYDRNMSDTFFHDLELPEPHHHLGQGGTTHAEQTARIMVAYEQLCLKERPALTVVVGDVNSTLAATLAAKKLQIPVAHLEAGLRSFDRTMPEEINRIVTDSLADLLWTPSADADENLLREGRPREQITLVGNIMIDSLEMLRSKFDTNSALSKHRLINQGFALVTLHRPVNVDSDENLRKLYAILVEMSQEIPLLFPIHPRTLKGFERCGLLSKLESLPRLRLVEPLGYNEFMSLLCGASLVLTDSGGIQEETTYLKIPCFTMRENTERPITITQGTNRLVSFSNVIGMVKEVLKSPMHSTRIPELWDGETAGRVVTSISQYFRQGQR